jgi:hypothetical protein
MTSVLGHGDRAQQANKVFNWLQAKQAGTGLTLLISKQIQHILFAYHRPYSIVIYS